GGESWGVGGWYSVPGCVGEGFEGEGEGVGEGKDVIPLVDPTP
ncbi:hypothetical protein Tco_0607261, partial [Tanacetum coccineum]